uniref:Uncharacterized protein n=1 Tax=Echeneis naucrates TaxID=173247 RepID=A0A665XDZ5_ECHNA
ITRDASFRARDAFISPSAAITCVWSNKESFTSLISTRSTLMPQLSVASSRLDWKSNSALIHLSVVQLIKNWGFIPRRPHKKFNLDVIC